MSAAAHAGLTVLGVDYGRKRIGFAVGQTLTRTASALQTLPTQTHDLLWRTVSAWLCDYAVQAFVIGMPTHADGSAHQLSAEIRAFAKQLQRRYQLPVYEVDERLSSHEAVQRQQAYGGDNGVDALAAQIILETWLNTDSTR